MNTKQFNHGTPGGMFPLGVSHPSRSKRFVASCGNGRGKRIYLGAFPSPMEAHKAWQLFKASATFSAVISDPGLTDAVRSVFMERIAKLIDDCQNNRETYSL